MKRCKNKGFFLTIVSIQLHTLFTCVEFNNTILKMIKIHQHDHFTTPTNATFELLGSFVMELDIVESNSNLLINVHVDLKIQIANDIYCIKNITKIQKNWCVN